jgi:molybdopterin/thiamine biosynthesis adenylyltransferase
VKSGVGGLLIIDPDTLSWDNIARHELGVRSVTKSKAEAMTETLRADFPHIKVTAHDSRWEDVWRSEPDVLKNVDLIISTTADTGSELHLNLLARTEQLPRILFAWLEDRAGAAQALLVGGTGGCLGCGMSKFGIFSERVIYHPNRTLRRAPGCDEFYQPYSALEAEAAIAMIVEVAIDALASGSQRSRLTTWIGAKELIESDGGVIREEWVALRGDPGGGRIKISKDWNIEPTCPLCGSS